MHPVDLLIVALYGGAVVAIGFAAQKKQKTSADYFLGGGRMAWWAVGISILATSFSSTALVGGVGFGYEHGLFYAGLQLGDLLGFGIVCLVFMRWFHGRSYTTAYEFLEERLGPWARSLASLLFILQTLVRTGLLVYAPALVLATLLGWPIEAAIAVTAVAAIAYSSFGGIAAVVWTDLIQVIVIIVAVVASLALVASDLPSVEEAVTHAAETGRLDVFRDKPWNTGFSLPWILVAYGVLSLQVAGTNQQAVQRYLACADLRAARKAAMTGWAVGAVVVVLTLVLGVAIQAWHAVLPEALPGDLKGDQVIAAFIERRLPPGLAGLLIAAIFAASMSSLDSAIHSLSTALTVDFLRRFGRNQDRRRELVRARFATVVFGLVALGVAIYTARAPDARGLLEDMIVWLGYFAGPFVGLFLLAMTTRRVSQAGACGAVLAAFAAQAACVGWDLPARLALEGGLHRLWYAPASLLLTLLLGLLSGLVWPRKAASAPAGGPPSAGPAARG